MITSDRRGLGTRRKAEPLGVITRHRHLHHFIAQQAIPNVIQSASPIGPKLRRGGEEAARRYVLRRQVRQACSMRLTRERTTIGLIDPGHSNRSL